MVSISAGLKICWVGFAVQNFNEFAPCIRMYKAGILFGSAWSLVSIKFGMISGQQCTNRKSKQYENTRGSKLFLSLHGLMNSSLIYVFYSRMVMSCLMSLRVA